MKLNTEFSSDRKGIFYMKNNSFEIVMDENTGCITEIVHRNDPHKMNWCSNLTQWGKINTGSRVKTEYHDRLFEELKVKKIVMEDDHASVVYENNRYRITVDRSFNRNGNFTERYTVKNITDTVLCMNRDNFSIAFPFSDSYTYADDCMVSKCNTHIWCGYHCSWINALKMGNSDINLGLMLTKGSFVSYSQYACSSNVRGYFELEPETVFLKENEEYVFEWELFWHKGKQDFFEKISNYPHYIGIDAKHYTIFEGEKIEFKISTQCLDDPVILCNHQEVAYTKKADGYDVSYSPESTGEYKFFIQFGEIKTYADFLVKIPFRDLVEKRIHYIVDHQQCLDQTSPLYGAYLIYDNKAESQFFDFYNTDHNACRERMNMPLAIIKYLQNNDDEKVKNSLNLYMDFLFREFYEEKTGEVFNNIGKRRDALRLYNSPGVMLIFVEMYYYTKDEKYLDNIVMLAKKYYSIGGEKCYSNAVSIKRVYNAFVIAGRQEDAKLIKSYFGMHTQNMIDNGLSYPKHEANYEQTIVTPVVNYISQYGTISEEKEYYITNAKLHLEILERFMGNQPSFYLNEISIRYWDAFWFGKGKNRGDTLPHHLSCLSARAFISYAELTGNTDYILRAENCLRNCMCLLDDNGQGSAAYVYPNFVNGSRGEYFDEWANDQDLIIYDAIALHEVYKTTFNA